ncbi:PIN domain-containing protein [Ferroplasma sp.]|uniref:type II toxin-antitoxin system VapC family toxin n=1 Tax=Ferroplasma sp. TaxID=2591003 RepID=UPI002620A4E5|nr:PIN domain-containing protein [Ferroplasma sp.]
MECIDTNILISFIDKNDTKHSMAEHLLNKYKNKIISELNIIEIRSVLFRNNLEEEKIGALIDYLLIKGEIQIKNIDINMSIMKGNEIVNNVKLKTLDLLHISNAILMNADRFVTFDKDLIKKKNSINDYKVEIIDAL